LILPPDLAWLAVTGHKTSHRLPERPGDRDEFGIYHRYEPGQIVSVQPAAGKPAVGRVRILDVRTELLGDITDEAARMEGEYGNFGAFIDDWTARYGEWDDDRPVWVLEFRPYSIARPRMLHRDSSRLYTSNPAMGMAGEPEAVDEQWQEAVTAQAKERALWAAKRSEADRALLSTEERVRLAQDIAKRRRVGLRDELRTLRAMERQGRPKDQIARQVVVIERKAYPRAA
jgi:hypothetical protein